MTIEDMKKQKQQLTYDIAALVQKFEQESGMRVDNIRVKRSEGYANSFKAGHSSFLGVELEVSLNG